MDRQVTASFWAGKRVFITGCTGFKGSWLSLWLLSLGATVEGFALAPETHPALWTGAGLASELSWTCADIRDFSRLRDALVMSNPDIVFHLAAQPLVRKSYVEPKTTFETNVMGTVNLLEACRILPNLRAILVVTSDKVYRNEESSSGYSETDCLGGYDPYSASKAATELVTAAYAQSFFGTGEAVVASARAGNVIGGGDWSLDRLIPDVVRSLASKTPLEIRYPLAVRPWQHVLCPLSGYLCLAEALWDKGQTRAGAWNFGPNTEDEVSVEALLLAIQQLEPTLLWRSQGGYQPHETQRLKLDWSKAKKELNWSPKWALTQGLDQTIKWYRDVEHGASMKAQCLAQIQAFSK